MATLVAEPITAGPKAGLPPSGLRRPVINTDSVKDTTTNFVKTIQPPRLPVHQAKEEEKSTISNNFSYESVTLPLVDRFIDEPRPLKVAVIGGGLSGILAGILLPKKVPGIQLTIYEKNDDFVSKSLPRFSRLQPARTCAHAVSF